MPLLEGWLDPSGPEDIEFKEPVGKTVARARFCKDGDSGDFLEFQFTDGTIFRIDPQARFKVQFMDVDNEGDLAGEVTDYGVLGESVHETDEAVPE